MWAAYLALNLLAFAQSIGGIDNQGRAHAKRARRELFCLPARVLTDARQTLVRFAPPCVPAASRPPGTSCGPCPPPSADNRPR